MKQPFRTFAPYIVVAVVAVCAGIAVSGFTAHAGIFGDLFGRFGSSQSGTAPTPSTPSAYLPSVEYESAIVSAVEKNAPAVVSIVITKDLPVLERCQVNPFDGIPPQFRDFFDFGPFTSDQSCDTGKKSRQEVGGGSGFIVSTDGLIVTNKHVVADTDASYTVLTNDGKKYEAKVLARDPVQDLALVKVNAAGVAFTKVNLSSVTVKLGQTAIAIGNALGEFRNTVSVGIVSGLSRDITASGGGESERLEGLIQTDAAINPGNSGGPLLNLRGEVIGINTAVASGAQNIGFAIPVDAVRRDIESVQRSGKIESPFLGIRYLTVTPELAKREKLSVDYGVLVRGSQDGPAVVAGSPAATAGIQAEDVIVEIDGEKVTAERSLSSVIQRHQVGDTVSLKILRAGKELTVSATLKSRDS